MLALEVVKEHSMELICARVWRECDVAAAGAAILGLEGSGVDTEFFHGIHGRGQAVHVSDVIAPAHLDRHAVHVYVPVMLLAAANLKIIPGTFAVAAFHLR